MLAGDQTQAIHFHGLYNAYMRGAILIKVIIAIVVFSPYVISIVAFLFSKLVWATSLVGIEIFVNLNEKINQYILAKWSLILPVDFVNIISYGNLKALFYTLLASIALGFLLFFAFLVVKKPFNLNNVLTLDVFLTFSILYMTFLVYFVAASSMEVPNMLKYLNLSLFFLMKFVRTLLHKIDPDPTLDLNYQKE